MSLKKKGKSSEKKTKRPDVTIKARKYVDVPPDPPETRRTIIPKPKIVENGVTYKYHNTASPPPTRDWDTRYAKTTAIHRASRFDHIGLKTKIVEGKKDGRTVYHLYVEKRVDKLPKQRKFKVGHITRIFEEAGKYRSRTDAADAAEKLGDRYYTRVTKVKVKDYAKPRPFQLWKCKKPAWK